MDRLRRSGSSIVAKLNLMNLLILLAVGGVVAVNLAVSHQVGDALNALIDHDLSRIIHNAELSRNLNNVFAETHLLLNTFTERKDVLNTEGRRLLAIVQASVAARERDALHDALTRFQRALTALLDQCAVIIYVSDRLQTVEKEFEDAITALDNLVAHHIIARKIEGKDYELFALEQVAASLPDYRSLLLQIVTQLDNVRQDYLSANLVEETHKQQIQALLDDLSVGLLTITTAGDEFALSDQQFLALIQQYRKEIAEFHQAMRKFQAQLRDLNDKQARLVAEMQTVEDDITQTSERIRAGVAEKFRSSGDVTAFFSLVVLMMLIGVGLYARRIIRPILRLTLSAGAIANGNLDAPIPLEGGADEIGRLARSFARMRDVIRAEMAALAEKNAALQTEMTERGRAEDALRLLNDELEQRVSQRTADIEAINKELKEFAHVVSHDLKAPLRGICQLAQWLRQDYAETLGAKGAEQVELLTNQAKRMEQLIDGILRYSKAVHGSEREGTVNLNALTAQVIDMLMPPPNISIRVADELPVISGDPVRVAQVFQNLLSNAVKFMDKPEGNISIGCADSGAMWTFSVEDNGPGIAPQHFERIFRIFQTMTPSKNTESTGIGLAVVKKIVELYGGRVWVESAFGEGSRFSFTWPKCAGERT